MQTNNNQNIQTGKDTELEKRILDNSKKLGFVNNATNSLAKAAEEYNSAMNTIGYEGCHHFVRQAAEILVQLKILPQDYMLQKAKTAAEKVEIEMISLIDGCDKERGKAGEMLIDLERRIDAAQELHTDLRTHLVAKTQEMDILNEEYKQINKGNKTPGRTSADVLAEYQAAKAFVISRQDLLSQCSNELIYSEQQREQVGSNVTEYESLRAKLSEILYNQVKPAINKGALTTNIGNIAQKTAEVVVSGSYAIQNYSTHVDRMNELTDNLTTNMSAIDSLSMEPKSTYLGKKRNHSDSIAEVQSKMQTLWDKAQEVIERRKAYGIGDSYAPKTV